MSSVRNVVAGPPAPPSTMSARSKSYAIHSVLALLLVLFSSLNLRPLLTGVAPLLHDIQADLALSNFGVSVLMTFPVVCLGVFGPLTAPLSRRFGLETVLLAAMAAVLAGAVLRSFALAACERWECPKTVMLAPR